MITQFAHLNRMSVAITFVAYFMPGARLISGSYRLVGILIVNLTLIAKK
ncbi:hypothetical protein [Chitinophaga sancti]|uniref:Uncharacterized protein n=1 Tax=Chitinophaga sancti TaxID=1004 RepID=A0A1K1SP74_9BACT|nr:hypothetical protein [Chitinophaga sancti]WQD64412.1 hypothetical protein U0033_08385 [Chitinophaga sancti]WQG89964.1 hypothetical protein SR876_00535 [Chitinophaga sancti]SFW86216.1 hypothetical protein SAMN05661012_05861 [Chitinophaga sancti]